jgi:hypothetical protein
MEVIFFIQKIITYLYTYILNNIYCTRSNFAQLDELDFVRQLTETDRRVILSEIFSKFDRVQYIS